MCTHIGFYKKKTISYTGRLIFKLPSYSSTVIKSIVELITYECLIKVKYVLNKSSFIVIS